MTKLQCFIATVSLTSSLLTVNLALAARVIKVEVELDGEVLLEGSHSDDGHSDADEVWSFYAHNNAAQEAWVGLRQTHSFSEESLKPIASNKGRFLLKAPGGKKITVSVLYGGKAKVRELTLFRVERLPQAENGNKTEISSANTNPIWYLDSKQLKDLFGQRMITRRQSAKLKNPKKLECLLPLPVTPSEKASNRTAAIVWGVVVGFVALRRKRRPIQFFDRKS